jgi:hypothetical protein
MVSARVSSLHVYPVKGCAGIRVDRAEVVERGFAYDRRWMIVDAGGQFVTQRTDARLALIRATLDHDAQEITLEAPGLAPLSMPARFDEGPRRTVQVWSHTGVGVAHAAGEDWISRYLGTPHALVYMPDDQHRPVNPAYASLGDSVSFADAYPFLLISQASLADLNARLPAPITMARFRPNIVVSGCPPFAEDGWAQLRIGALGFRGVKRCDRCVVTTIDPETGTGGVEPLRTLATFRREAGAVWFGMNLIHDGAGELAVGDAVTIDE